MRSRLVRCNCPHCSQSVVQVANTLGPNVCPHCFRFFDMPLPKTVPLWIWGVLAVLAANCFAWM